MSLVDSYLGGSRSRGRVRLTRIPHTQAVTTLGALRTGARVNVEIDQIARYVERLLGDSGRL